MRAENLHADGQTCLGSAARNGDPANACKAGSHGVNVGEIHGERITGFFAQLERGSGCSGRNNCIHVCKRTEKLVGEKTPYFLRLKVIGVVVAGG